MAEAPEEVAEMVAAAGALVLNIGTLSATQVDAMLIAGRRANELGIPVVLDPVGVGATRFRTETAQRILDTLDVAVLKGNAGDRCPCRDGRERPGVWTPAELQEIPSRRRGSAPTSREPSCR